MHRVQKWEMGALTSAVAPRSLPNNKLPLRVADDGCNADAGVWWGCGHDCRILVYRYVRSANGN